MCATGCLGCNEGTKGVQASDHTVSTDMHDGVIRGAPSPWMYPGDMTEEVLVGNLGMQECS